CNYPHCDDFLSNVRAAPELYTLSLHDALPICGDVTQVEPKPGKKVSLATTTTQFDTTRALLLGGAVVLGVLGVVVFIRGEARRRSEEHTSELQSPYDLVCRLLLEKKKSVRYGC